ncbi:hypothetical protein GUJ93_ZPchr0002g23771 [Zizania palustris]|uniref:Uncharacterized protein n=1 Tax=Zizania palustris TaxID=103762 RepID=A0A8J5RCL1_ZIZPA|nr:hypothetical protein GUJ93_ZPchr0002g23771 [Zizania palustris]
MKTECGVDRRWTVDWRGGGEASVGSCCGGRRLAAAGEEVGSETRRAESAVRTACMVAAATSSVEAMVSAWRAVRTAESAAEMIISMATETSGAVGEGIVDMASKRIGTEKTD